MNNTCLVIVFNHQYNANIPKLRKIYTGRFTNIKFLVPFYRGYDQDVIPVYESSYQYQGYFAQAMSRLFDTNDDWYFFIGDDVMIHPEMTSDSILEYLNMEGKEFYIHSIDAMNRPHGICWSHAMFSAKSFRSRGVMWKSLLPSIDDAYKRFECFFGKPYETRYNSSFFEVDNKTDNDKRNDFLRINGGDEVIYPLASSYADVLLVKRNMLLDFSHMCGVSAAMNLFVEIAIPTAIVLLTDRRNISLFSDTGYLSKLEWNDPEYFRTINEKYHNDYWRFKEEWDDNYLYLHPIKLSKWNI